MREAEDDTETLREHVMRAFISVRVGIGAVGAVLPVLLWLGALIVDGEPLKPSMSAYYYSRMGDVFVGALASVGVFLYLYKGFSTREKSTWGRQAASSWRN